MSITKRHILAIVVLILTGTIVTLMASWSNKMEALGSERVHVFKHPFLMVFIMFLAYLTWLPFYGARMAYNYIKCINEEYDSFNVMLLIPPALLDMAVSSILFFALSLTHASTYQMIRGTLLIFGALVSVAFLRASLSKCKWFGILVMAVDGFLVVGIAHTIHENDKKLNTMAIITGILLIVVAQIILAFLLTYEQWFFAKYNVPLSKALGYEGLFGFITISICLIPFYYVSGGILFNSNPFHRIEDFVDVYYQMKNEPLLIVPLMGTYISEMIYMYSAFWIIKEFSALTFLVLDSFRSVIVSIVSFIVVWEPFYFLYIIGFALLIFGCCMYFNITILNLYHLYKSIKADSSLREQIFSSHRQTNNNV